jgi:ribosomal protein S18 acetylase RimI-like enzyme
MVRVERNGVYEISELNNLLATMKWDVKPIEKLEKARSLTWGWIIARDEKDQLIGFVRILSDGIYHAYILHMIVHPDYQGRGIGKAIMKELMRMLGEQRLVPTLVAAPGKAKFYKKFGFEIESNGCTAMCIRKPYWELQQE